MPPPDERTIPHATSDNRSRATSDNRSRATSDNRSRATSDNRSRATSDNRSRATSDNRSRAVRHEDNEKRILDAAMQLVVDGGFDGLSMSRLADAVGFTPGALYRYIGSKDALLAKIIESALASVHAYLDRAARLVPEGSSPLAMVFALALGYRAFARERPHPFGLLAMSMAEPRVLLSAPEDAGIVVQQMVSALTPLSAAIERATAVGQLQPGDVPERTICLFALLQGVLQLHKQARYARGILDLDRLATSGVSALLLGWGATRADVDEASRMTAGKHSRATSGNPSQAAADEATAGDRFPATVRGGK